MCLLWGNTDHPWIKWTVHCALIGRVRNILNITSQAKERNSRKLDGRQDLNILYQVFVFRADQKTKMAIPASDWPRYFQLLLWNCWTEFKETRQEARTKCPLLSFIFSGRSEKQDVRPGLCLVEAFLTSPLKLLYGFGWNLTGSKISTSSTKFIFFDKHNDIRFPIVNFPWLSGDVPRLPLYSVYISQLVRFSRCCTSVLDFHSKNPQITPKLLTLGYRYHKLGKSLWKFFWSYSDPNLVKYCFKNMFLKESLTKSSTVIYSTN